MQKIVEETTLKIAKLISYNFLTVLASQGSQTKLRDFYPNVESRKLDREWFALQVLLMVIAISSHYKDDPVGMKIAQYFRMYIIKGLSDAGVYGSEDEATAFIKSRLEEFHQQSLGKNENPMLKLSLQFLKFVDLDDALLLINTGEQISSILQTNKKLVEEAEKIAKESR